MKTINRQTPLKLQDHFLRRCNSLETIEHLKGLNIQPFIFALVKPIPHLEATLGDPPFWYSPQAADHRPIITAFTNALYQAGYSDRGTPYWTKPQGPHLEQMRHLVECAENCLPLLNHRRQTLYQATQTTSDRRPRVMLRLFEREYGRFTRACNGITALADADETVRWEREGRMRISNSNHMCALA